MTGPYTGSLLSKQLASADGAKAKWVLAPAARGTEGSNPASSTSESSANQVFSNQWRSSHAAAVGALTYSWRRSPTGA
jgi:hypothetical protein